jgi:aspartate-semialdehyde dehydrogenase
MSEPLRIAVVGATGTLGSDLIAVLDEDRFPVADLQVWAGERSVGTDVEFRGDVLEVRTGEPVLQALDLVFVCTPAPVALQVVRTALRAEVACIDCSGSLAASNDVPMAIADLGAHEQVVGASLITAPTGPALSWALVLSALQRAAGLARVTGTVLHSASCAGRRGIDELSEQTLALLNQSKAPDPKVFPAPLAFDCLPHALGEDSESKDGSAPGEAALAGALRRLLGPDVGIGVTGVHMPIFAGEASSLTVETRDPLSVEMAARVLEEAPGVDLWEDATAPPSAREGVGHAEALVGRLRADTSSPEPGRGLSLWIAADPVRLAAVNAVKLARARFSI